MVIDIKQDSTSESEHSESESSTESEPAEPASDPNVVPDIDMGLDNDGHEGVW